MPDRFKLPDVTPTNPFYWGDTYDRYRPYTLEQFTDARRTLDRTDPVHPDELRLAEYVWSRYGSQLADVEVWREALSMYTTEGLDDMLFTDPDRSEFISASTGECWDKHAAMMTQQVRGWGHDESVYMLVPGWPQERYEAEQAAKPAP